MTPTMAKPKPKPKPKPKRMRLERPPARTEVVPSRYTPAEVEQIVERAGAAGFHTVADYQRHCVLENLRTPRRTK